jgi:hypothetical protein
MPASAWLNRTARFIRSAGRHRVFSRLDDFIATNARSMTDAPSAKL